MSNEFIKAENEGRNLMYNVLTQQLNLDPNTILFTSDYCRHDCETEQYLIEIKVRNIAHNQYHDFILEADKLDYMLQMSADTGKKPLYVNFFNDGVCVIWSLSTVKERVQPEPKRCRKTTAKYGEYIDKQVYMIRVDDTALTIKYN